MTGTDRHILATSGGFVADPVNPYRIVPGPLISHALSLAAPRSDGSRPLRVCYLATATGDDAARIAAVYAAFAPGAGSSTLNLDVRVSHLALFPMPNVPDPHAHLMDQDVVWVGGGSVANLLAVWRTHSLDLTFTAAWEAGVVLGGVSAGSICWHVGGTTDSFGTRLRPVGNGLGLLPYGNGVHYDSEPGRRPLLHRLVADGTLPTSYATDDGVGIHYRGTDVADVVADRPGVAAYRVERSPDGTVAETRLPPRVLGPRAVEAG